MSKPKKTRPPKVTKVPTSDVAEVECFVAGSGKVVPVPETEYGYTGYALVVGKDVFATKDEAVAEAHKRATKDVQDYKSWLKRAEERLARLA